MGLVMEFVMLALDIIFDTIIEGSNKSGKPVHIFWRVLMLLLVLIAYIGLAGVSIFIGYNAVKDNDILIGLLFFGLAFIVIIGGIYEIRKVFKKRKNTEIP